MKERLTNVLHWFCFLTALLMTVGSVVTRMYFSRFRGEFGDFWFDLYWFMSFGEFRFPDIVMGGDWAVVGILLFLLGGWAFKYVLTGRKGFFPWMTK
jgi:hypothetical protein